jgi:hypothetical protein
LGGYIFEKFSPILSDGSLLTHNQREFSRGAGGRQGRNHSKREAEQGNQDYHTERFFFFFFFFFLSYPPFFLFSSKRFYSIPTNFIFRIIRPEFIQIFGCVMVGPENVLTCDESCMEWETFSVSTFLYLQSARIVEDLLVFGVEKRLINFCKYFLANNP